MTVYKLILLHHRHGYIRDARNRSCCDLVGAVLPAIAQAVALKFGVGRSELCEVLLNADQLFYYPVTTGLYLQIKIPDIHFAI